MIDVNRPLIPNSDGSFSTEETITLNANEVGGPNMAVTIPTIVGGMRRSPDEAVSLFAQGQNPPVQWGFDNFDDAEVAAQGRTDAIAGARQTRGPTIASSPIAPMAYTGRTPPTAKPQASPPSPRPRPDNNYFDVDEATRIDDMGNYVGSGQSPGVPDPSPRPNMSIAPPPSPTKASEPAVRPIPASMAVEAPPAAPEKRGPAGVSFISPASIPNLAPTAPPADLKAGEASESITSPMSVIEAAIQDFDSATPSQAAAPSMPPPAATMRPPTPPAQASPTNMATAPPAAGATIQTTQAPSMATASPGGGWFSKLFTPNTGGSKGFSPSGGGVSPSGLAYRTGTGLGGNPALQWTNSKGQTVTVVENGFNQPGYSTGFG